MPFFFCTLSIDFFVTAFTGLLLCVLACVARWKASLPRQLAKTANLCQKLAFGLAWQCVYWERALFGDCHDAPH